jgi:hypothetical protein
MKMKSLFDKPRTCKCGKTNKEVEFRDRSNQCKECYRKLIQSHNKKRPPTRKIIIEPFDWIWNNNI